MNLKQNSLYGSDSPDIADIPYDFYTRSPVSHNCLYDPRRPNCPNSHDIPNSLNNTNTVQSPYSRSKHNEPHQFGSWFNNSNHSNSFSGLHNGNHY